MLQFAVRKGVPKSDPSGMLLSQEREAWAREKVRLEKALHQAQAQAARLRGEIRSDALREMTGPQADNAALKVGHRFGARSQPVPTEPEAFRFISPPFGCRGFTQST